MSVDVTIIPGNGDFTLGVIVGVFPKKKQNQSPFTLACIAPCYVAPLPVAAWLCSRQFTMTNYLDPEQDKGGTTYDDDNLERDSLLYANNDRSSVRSRRKGAPNVDQSKLR